MGSNCSCIAPHKMGTRRTPTITKVELNLEENSKLHHTNKFEAWRNHLIIRRGDPFKLTVRFDSELNLEKDELIVVFKTSPRPRVSNATEVAIEVTQERLAVFDRWLAWTSSTPDKEITLNIEPKSDAVVAIWKIELHVYKQQDRAARKPPVSSHTIENVYLLFNPWNKDDGVYVKDESRLEEYILNDVGKIWRGNAYSFRGMVWNYGQFETGMLEACMKLLDTSPRLRYKSRASPILVSREMSAMVNSNDGDRGVVVGNWSGKYEDGNAPTDWQGSVQILDQWMETGRSVRYGQCWVFSGVLTTVMRALGIPCRPITNFESAHDTDATITLDIHVDMDGNRVEEMDNDSVWNFHVWNEVYMSRPDLPPGYGGWQVIDSTPQETSEGVFQVGPASVAAIRKGEVGLKYDSAFVFAEVNSDKITWLYNGPDEPLEVLQKDTMSIGKFISTKKIGTALMGNKDRWDVTYRYKPQEMTEEERMAVLNAVNTGRSAARNIYRISESMDVTCTLEVDNSALIGRDVPITIKIKNDSSEPRKVSAIVSVSSMFYTGALHLPIKKVQQAVNLTPKGDTDVEVIVKGIEYTEKLIDQATMMVSVMLQVKETGQVFHNEANFRVRIPGITIEADEKLKVGKPSKVTAYFTNPLSVQLKNCRFIVEGPGLGKPNLIPVNDVGPKEKSLIKTEITPKRAGDLVLLVSFCSNNLRDVDGSIQLNVTK